MIFYLSGMYVTYLLHVNDRMSDNNVDVCELFIIKKTSHCILSLGVAAIPI